MASLDNLEGSLLEGGGLLLVIVLIVAIFLGAIGSKGLLNWLIKLLNELAKWLESLFGGPKGSSFLGKGAGTTSTVKSTDAGAITNVTDGPIDETTAYNSSDGNGGTILGNMLGGNLFDPSTAYDAGYDGGSGSGTYVVGVG